MYLNLLKDDEQMQELMNNMQPKQQGAQTITARTSDKDFADFVAKQKASLKIKKKE